MADKEIRIVKIDGIEFIQYENDYMHCKYISITPGFKHISIEVYIGSSRNYKYVVIIGEKTIHSNIKLFRKKMFTTFRSAAKFAIKTVIREREQYIADKYIFDLAIELGNSYINKNQGDLKMSKFKQKFIELGLEYNTTFHDVCSLSYRENLTKTDIFHALSLIEKYENLHGELIRELKIFFKTKL